MPRPGEHLLHQRWMECVGGGALVAGWAARAQEPGTKIAAVFPDGPLRYFDTIYNDDYCRQHALLDVAPPSQSAVIEDPMQQVVQSWTRCAAVVDPVLVKQ